MDLFNQEPKERVFQKIPLLDGEVWYMENFIPLDKANSCFQCLMLTYCFLSQSEKSIFKWLCSILSKVFASKANSIIPLYSRLDK
jgi:hypothetical protein